MYNYPIQGGQKQVHVDAKVSHIGSSNYGLTKRWNGNNLPSNHVNVELPQGGQNDADVELLKGRQNHVVILVYTGI